MSCRGTKRKKEKDCPGQTRITSFYSKKSEKDCVEREVGTIEGTIVGAGAGFSQKDGPTDVPARETVEGTDEIQMCGEIDDCSMEKQEEKKKEFQEKFKKKKKNSGHKEGYQQEWEKTYKWLYPVNNNTGMMCRICKHHDQRQQNGEYIWSRIPCTCLRSDKVRNHNTSQQHKRAEQKELARIAAEANGGIRQAMANTVELNREAVKAAMKVVYHLAKKEIPHHTNFKDLVNFAVDELGCEVLGRLRVAENAMYTSSTIVDEFLAVLGKQVEETQLTTISGSQFLGLMCDETVDISTTNEMVLYCRCIDDNGELQAKFLKVIALRDGKADTVKKALTDYLEEKDISIQKVAGFGSDGAPCMIGSKTGVAKQLKDDNAKIVSIHCVAHRLALAVGQAGNNVKHIGEVFKPNLLSLFLYYHGSAVRSEGLKEIQELFEDPQLKLKQPKDVRWLSHDAATKALYTSLPSVLVHLNAEMKKGVVIARSLWMWLRNYKTIAILYLLCDVLPHLSALSKCFQEKRLDLTEIHRTVESKREVIRLARDEPLAGGRLAELDADLGPGGRLVDLDIVVSDQQRAGFRSACRAFIDYLDDNLEGRFPQTELLAAFSVLDPRCLPREMPGEYGWEELATLSNFYSDGYSPIDKEALRDEWIAYRLQMGNRNYRQKTPKEMCQLLSSKPTLACQFPNIASLYARMVVMPVHTADCERAFSTLKRVKTRLRSTLSNDHLNYLLMIRIEGPKDFDFDEAVRRWGNLRNRRLLL